MNAPSDPEIIARITLLTAEKDRWQAAAARFREQLQAEVLQHTATAANRNRLRSVTQSMVDTVATLVEGARYEHGTVSVLPETFTSVNAARLEAHMVLAGNGDGNEEEAGTQSAAPSPPAAPKRRGRTVAPAPIRPYRPATLRATETGQATTLTRLDQIFEAVVVVLTVGMILVFGGWRAAIGFVLVTAAFSMTLMVLVRWLRWWQYRGEGRT